MKFFLQQPPSNNNNPCPWYGWRDIFEGTSRIYSIGRELHHGTVCVFELFYQKRGDFFDTISSSCSGRNIIIIYVSLISPSLSYV